jgi:DNA-binding NarL/FixJ family response regulator
MDALVLDEHPITAEMLRLVITSAFEGAVIQIARDLESGHKLARGLPPDALVLLDVLLPGHCDLEALTNFLSYFPHLRVVVISAIKQPKVVRRAIELGAAGYIPKTADPKTIAAALRLVATGAVYVPAEVFIDVGRQAAVSRGGAVMQVSSNLYNLTVGEIRVLRLVCAGFTNKDIASHLSISVGTVKQHLHRVYDKFGASTRSEAIIMAVRQGLFPGTSKPGTPG